MNHKILVLHLPVIHKGYLQLFESLRKEIEAIGILDNELIAELSPPHSSIEVVDFESARKMLHGLGFYATLIQKKHFEHMFDYTFYLVDDEVSRNLRNTYLTDKPVIWKRVFLRWDRNSVLSTEPVNEQSSTNSFDQQMIKLAQSTAQSSSDWWRQVGAVLVKGDGIVLTAYNQGVMGDHEPYRHGSKRDFLNIGERPDLSPTLHAEQSIIVQAARSGISLTGTSLYITHYPCAVCAALIASSGIKYVFFFEGSSNLDAGKILKSARIESCCVRFREDKTISIIVAVDKNNLIGRKNQIPWHLPGDFKYFKNVTMSKTIIMGSRTFESIGKPLPGRQNIVLHEDKGYPAPGCIVATSIKEALALAESTEIFFIGGASIYQQVLPWADKLYITRVHHEFTDGDAFFPHINLDVWQEISRTSGLVDEKNIYPHTFFAYQRRNRE